METRKVSVTLNKAREWYDSGNAALKEVALQAFTEEELSVDYKSITTLKGAYKRLSRIREVGRDCVEGLRNGSRLLAIYDIDTICEALNGDWKPSLISGKVYYPWVKFYKVNDVPDNRKMDITNYFMYNKEKYALVGGVYGGYGYGLGYYYGGAGDCYAYTGLFGCKSKDIALHMSRYFAKEIFLACFASKLDGEIKWLIS